MNFTPESKVLVQGITTSLGSDTAARMKAYGTNIVAGVSVGQGGQDVQDIPVFDLVEQACHEMGKIETTIICMEPYHALDAALEAIDAGIPQIILVSDHIPPLDMVSLLRKAKVTDTLIVGPGSSGIIVPGKVLLGTQDTEFYTPGRLGIISRTRTLSYEVALTLTQAKLGQSIAVNLGTDGIVGSSFRQWLEILDNDETTQAIVLVDHTGGSGAEETVQMVKAIHKPVIAYIAGHHTPRDRQGNPNTILAAQISASITNSNTAQDKVAVFKQGKVPVADYPSQIPNLVKKTLKKK